MPLMKPEVQMAVTARPAGNRPTNAFLKICSLMMLSLLFLLSATACQRTGTDDPPQGTETPQAQEMPEPEESPEISEATTLQPVHEVVDTPLFGYGDLKGIYGILLSDPKTVQPRNFTMLALPDGGLTGITFDGIQPPGPNDNRMDISSNFEQSYGAVYRLSSGKIPENDSVTFMTARFAELRTFRGLTKVVAVSESASLIEAVQTEKGLNIRSLWHLYDIEGGSAIYLAKFEPKNNQGLLSLILVHNGSRWYGDFPAHYVPELNLYSWRVDDGGEILPENFIVGWMAEFGNQPELALYWRGAEGELLYWLRGENGQLIKANEAFRYWGAY